MRQHSQTLGADVLRCIGYRATDGRTYTGPVRKARPDAVADAAERREAVRLSAAEQGGTLPT